MMRSMTSDELNAAISALDVAEETPYASAIGGKAIPYIGWYWRNVNFDADCVWLGIIPPNADGNETPLIGFMENNKWGYSNVMVDGSDWQSIKDALIAAVLAPSHETLRAVDETINKAGMSRWKGW